MDNALANKLHAQLGPPDKGCAIKVFVDWWMFPKPISLPTEGVRMMHPITNDDALGYSE